MALLLFIKTIIMSVICCIITEHSGFKITNELNYIVNDFIIFIIEIIKIFGTIVIIGLLTLLLEISFKKQGVVSLFLIALLTLIFFGDKMYPSGIFIIDIFNPGFQSHGYTLINSLLVLISYCLIYFITIIMLLYVGIKKKIKDYHIDHRFRSDDRQSNRNSYKPCISENCHQHIGIFQMSRHFQHPHEKIAEKNQQEIKNNTDDPHKDHIFSGDLGKIIKHTYDNQSR